MGSRLRLASPLLLAALAACQTTTATPRAGAPSVPPRDPRCAVEFWPGAERPRRAMDELAEIKVMLMPAIGLGKDSAREGMREKACALGADAIVDLHEEMDGGGSKLVGTAVRYQPQ